MAKLPVSWMLEGSLVAAALVVLAGCASRPRMANTTASHETASVPAENAQHLTATQKLVADARQEGLHGFYALVRGGQTMYCWRDRAIGSLIPSTQCVNSAAEVRSILRTMANQRHRMQDTSSGMCAGKSGCAGN